jgi:hypothetical protein
MKVRFRAAATIVSVVAVTSAVLIGGAAPALAVVPPFEPDSTNQQGQMQFYDANGNPVTSGTTTAALPKFAVATTNDPVLSDTSATLYAYTPVQGQLSPLWSGEQLSGTTAFPVASPASIAALGAHRPVVTVQAGSLKLADLIADFPNTNTAGSGWEGLYQFRIKTAGNTKWWAADVAVTGTTWTLAYPTAVVAHDSSMTISASTTISYGAATTTATLLRDTTTSTVIPSAPVKLYKRPNTSSSWTFVANATTSSTGRASKSVAPTARTLYQWRYAGTATHKPATSPTETVSVKQVVSAHSTRSTVTHGVAFKIYGTVKPASSGKTVTLQRLVGTTWNSVTSVTIKSQKLPNGVTTVGFVFTLRVSTVGTFKYRVYKPATTTLLAGYSSTLTVKVT